MGSYLQEPVEVVNVEPCLVAPARVGAAVSTGACPVVVDAAPKVASFVPDVALEEVEVGLEMDDVMLVGPRFFRLTLQPSAALLRRFLALEIAAHLALDLSPACLALCLLVIDA